MAVDTASVEVPACPKAALVCASRWDCAAARSASTRRARSRLIVLSIQVAIDATRIPTATRAASANQSDVNESPAAEGINPSIAGACELGEVQYTGVGRVGRVGR